MRSEAEDGTSIEVSMGSQSGGNPSRRWRYTWEALAHIPILRVYLFSPAINPSAHCLRLSATLRSEESLLLLRWTGADGVDFSVRVPVPRVLVDPSRAVDCCAREDHVEVKLALLLPVDHPVLAQLHGEEDEGADLDVPFSPSSDLEDLSTGVDFFCKSCSTKLTKQPISHFLEMPSAHWREVADNWFGACCCSFGGVSEKLVSDYVKKYQCKKGTCLLDAAIVILCTDDLNGYVFPSCSEECPENSYRIDSLANDNIFDAERWEGISKFGLGSHEECDASTFMPNKLERTTLSGCASMLDPCKSESITCTLPPPVHCCGSTYESIDTSYLAQQTSKGGQCGNIVQVPQSDLNCCFSDLEKPLIGGSVDNFSKDQDNCHDGKTMFASSKKADQPIYSLMPNERGIQLLASSLGSGFMIRKSNLSKDVTWVEFLCKKCLHPLGSYPSFGSASSPVDGGIRLLKCYISTSLPICSPYNIFRKYTLQKLFLCLLYENALDELSFRTVVKDLSTKQPVLQIVLLNSKAWYSTGCCLENYIGEVLPETGLKPVVKVLFSNCSTIMNKKSSMIEEWATRNHAEDVYMMSGEAKEIVECLSSALEALPLSISSLQGMFMSYILR